MYKYVLLEFINEDEEVIAIKENDGREMTNILTRMTVKKNEMMSLTTVK